MNTSDVRETLYHEVLDNGAVKYWVDGEPDSVIHQGVPWAYTIGRTMAGRPELLVTGLGEATSLTLLTELEHLDCAPDRAMETSVGTVAFIPAETGLLYGAFLLFGETFSALQVVWLGSGDQPIHAVGGLYLTDPYGDET